MLIRDEIRNFPVTKPLPSELIKKSEEYTTLAILKYALPERFSMLHKDESPDLQDTDGKLGVEVTSGESASNHIITGESIKYRHSNSEVEKEKILQKIKKNGGNIDGYVIDYPIGNAESDGKQRNGRQKWQCQRGLTPFSLCSAYLRCACRRVLVARAARVGRRNGA